MTDEQRFWATLLLYQIDPSSPRSLDPRVLDQPHTLLGAAHGRLSFDVKGITWTPSFHVHQFHPVAIAWTEIWSVLLDEAGWWSAMARHLYGHMRVICGKAAVEFSFPLVDSSAIETELARHLEPGQISVGEMLVT